MRETRDRQDGRPRFRFRTPDSKTNPEVCSVLSVAGLPHTAARRSRARQVSGCLCFSQTCRVPFVSFVSFVVHCPWHVTRHCNKRSWTAPEAFEILQRADACARARVSPQTVRSLRVNTDVLANPSPLVAKVIGCAIEVHRSIGPGLLESAYDLCLTQEFHLTGVNFQRDVPIPLVYKGARLSCGYRADFVIDNACSSSSRALSGCSRSTRPKC